eukprot:847704-Rhodomonas_salina.2
MPAHNLAAEAGEIRDRRRRVAEALPRRAREEEEKERGGRDVRGEERREKLQLGLPSRAEKRATPEVRKMEEGGEWLRRQESRERRGGRECP